MTVTVEIIDGHRVFFGLIKIQVDVLHARDDLLWSLEKSIEMLDKKKNRLYFADEEMEYE